MERTWYIIGRNIFKIMRCELVKKCAYGLSHKLLKSFYSRKCCTPFITGLCNPLNAELNPICYLLALLAHHFLHVSRIRVKSLTLRLLMLYIYIYIYIYMERQFLMFLDHTQRRTTVGRTPLDEWSARRREESYRPEESYRLWCVVVCDLETSKIGAPYIYDISNLRVKFYKPVHHRTIQIDHQPDAKIFQFIILTFIYNSTCFGRSPAHHQELNDCSSSLWFYRPDHEHSTAITTIRR